MQPQWKKLEVLGGPLDGQELELPAGGTELVGAPVGINGSPDGFYLDEIVRWRFVDKRFYEHMMTHHQEEL